MSLITDNFTLDLGEDSNLTLTKSIYNIQEPDKRQSSFTKTISVPSSVNNDKIFQSWFDVNFVLDNNNQFEPFFNPNKKAPCVLHTDTINQMTGYAQLTDISIVDGKVEYKLTLYGENRDLFAVLTDKKMNELDLSEYNHIYNETNIEASWYNTSGYVYPMVDYGDNHIHWVNNQVNAMDWWVTEHFKPWLFVKTLVDKIFQDAGFSYYSTFFNTDNFKKLIFQSDVDGLSKDDSEVEAMSADAIVNTELNYSNITPNRTGLYCYTNYPIIFDNEIFDPLAQYDPTTGVTNVNSSGQYDVIFDLNVRVTNNDVYTIPSGAIKTTFAVVKSNGDTIYSFTHTHQLLTGLVPTDYYEFNLGFGSTINVLTTDDFKLVVRATDIGGTIFYPPTNLTVKVKADSTYTISPIPQTMYGDTVNVSSLLNSEMTQKEFIMNLVKMFNLYIEPYYFRSGDANSGKYAQYLIETRDEYFTNDVIDWTMNLDNSKDFVIKPSALIDSKFLQFTYASDNDLMNDLYTGQTGRIYGDYLREIDNDFAKDTKKIEISFSPAIMMSSSQSDHWQDRIMPVIKNQDGTLRKDGKPKILFYNGLRTSTWNFNGTLKTSYPLASNVDDWDNPTTDLYFKQPKLIYYKGDSKGQVTFTNGTLFNKYYYRQIVETTDKNSKMIECYMRLRPSDVHSLSFRPLYFIRDAYYRLYEMVDHNYQDTTLCRFLKINEATPISNARTTTRGGRGVITGTTEKTPTKYIPIDTGIGDKFRGGLKDVTSGGGVLGGGVIKEGFVVNVSGNNVLTGGLYNQEIIRDNTVALGFNHDSVASGDVYVTGMEGSPYYLMVDTSLGNTTIHLPDETLYQGNVIYIKKTASANSVYINDSLDSLFTTLTTLDSTSNILYTKDGLIII